MVTKENNSHLKLLIYRLRFYRRIKIIMVNKTVNYANRPFKGKSLLEFPENYTVIDIESTGLDFNYDQIIEIGALRVRNRKVIDKYVTLIKPNHYHYIVNDEYIDMSEVNYIENINFNSYQKIYIDDFIVNLTGITNEMLEQAPYAKDIINDLYTFIGDDVLMGHNVNFDINFIYDLSLDISDHKLDNNFVDFLRVARKLYPQLPSHRLRDVGEYINIDINDMHRSIRDCEVVFEAFEYSRHYITDNNIDFLALWKKSKNSSGADLRNIVATAIDFDKDHMLFNKNIVFTGKLEKMPRAEAAQFVVNVGGFCQNGVNKKTNYLILGNNDYCSSIKDGKSSKQKKVEGMILEGLDIEIISENIFYEMLNI